MTAVRKPAWLKVRTPAAAPFRATTRLIDDLALHTVCDEARCPNRAQCFSTGTATFLVLGEVCTRACGFCAVGTVRPGGHGSKSGGGGGARPVADAAPDPDEPRRVAEAARRLGLAHVVVTSVTRDDLVDGGAGQFVATVKALRAAVPGATVELLVPDLGGDDAALAAVLAAEPDVIGHNLETVPRLYPRVRPRAVYDRSVAILRTAAGWARSRHSTDGRPHPSVVPSSIGARSRTVGARTGSCPLVKTGLMLGLGETTAEVDVVLRDAVAAGVDLVTVGQYLRPDARCLPVVRYATPEEFARWRRHGRSLGMTVHAAPFVRSSYRAGELLG